MDETEHKDQESEERAADPGPVRQTTPQGDELREEHAIGEHEERAVRPYARPRQPAQDPPSGR